MPYASRMAGHHAGPAHGVLGELDVVVAAGAGKSRW